MGTFFLCEVTWTVFKHGSGIENVQHMSKKLEGNPPPLAIMASLEFQSNIFLHEENAIKNTSSNLEIFRGINFALHFAAKIVHICSGVESFIGQNEYRYDHRFCLAEVLGEV